MGIIHAKMVLKNKIMKNKIMKNKIMKNKMMKKIKNRIKSQTY